MGQVIGTRPPTMAASVEVVKPRGQYDEVAVHPLVLLSVVDYFRRVEEDDSEDKRVVGVLLGEYRKGRLDVTSSFAVPFEEDETTRASGSSIIATWRRCPACSAGSTPRRRSWAGTARAPRSGRTTWTSTSSSPTTTPTPPLSSWTCRRTTWASRRVRTGWRMRFATTERKRRRRPSCTCPRPSRRSRRRRSASSTYSATSRTTP